METAKRGADELDDDIDVEAVPTLQEPIRKPGLKSVGRAAFFVAMCICLVVLGIPLLLISLVKSPELLPSVAILGVSYQKMVFALMLSSAMTAYVCMVFSGVRPLGILVLFALSVFSCFPLVAGLKNNLTLQQAIVDIPFFRSWPFFLRPGYILIEFLIPVAIVSSLILLTKSILSRKPYRFTFLLVTLYLGIAAFLGFSALNKAGQPNLVSAFTWIKGTWARQPTQRRVEIPLPQADDPAAAQGQGPILNQPPVRAGKTESLATGAPAVDLERQVQVLSDKVDRLLKVLTQTEPHQGPSQGNPPTANTDPGKEQGRLGRIAPSTAAESAVDKPAVEDIGSNVQVVREKVERVLETLTRMQAVLPSPQENAPVDKGVDEADHAAEAPPVVQSSVQPVNQPEKGAVADNSALEDLNQRVHVLSDKMDRVMETLVKLESLLPRQEKGTGQRSRVTGK